MEVNIIPLGWPRGLPGGVPLGPTAFSSASLSFLPRFLSSGSIISKYMLCACSRGHRVVVWGCAAVLKRLLQRREDCP